LVEKNLDKSIKKKQTGAMDSLITMMQSMSVMAKAIWISVFVHAVILSLHFEPELKKFKDNYLH